MAGDTITVGGASGFWGDATLATPQLLASGKLDYLVYDYLAEITMSIMARARAADDSKGYALDFVSAVLAPNLPEIARQGVRVIANAGGVNVRACAEAARALIADLGLELTVAAVLGDDLTGRAEEFAGSAVTEMFSGEPFPDPASVASINAYLGAFPIAQALATGADIVITGRCVDSAVTLGACIHAFGWRPQDYDLLAAGSLAGHILECGTQATGGNFTDWETVVDSLPEAGYPMAEIGADGVFTVTKPEGSGGAVTVGTVAEQMLYEIGDPQAYLLPDVVCDFSAVKLVETAPHWVRVSGARGHGAPAGYKASATYADGFRSGQVWTMYGRDADRKAEQLAELVFRRTATVLDSLGLPPLSETSCEVIGAETHYGRARRVGRVREVDVKIAAKHPGPKGIAVFLKEMIGMALTAPPGLSGFAGARPKPSPVVRLFSMIVPKTQVAVTVESATASQPCSPHAGAVFDPSALQRPPVPTATGSERVTVVLESVAWGRSGDKGDKANIGIIARDPAFLPWIAAAFSEQRVADFFSHFLAPGQARPVERFYMPGPPALNFLLHDVLGGGGVASLRADPQGKGYAQLLLGETLELPRELAARFDLPPV
jgi:hypothetical protein